MYEPQRSGSPPSSRRSSPHLQRGPSRVEAVGRTDIGRVRANNEDRFAVLDHLGLFMVADGMGGHACGEVAATLAIAAVTEAFEEHGDALREPPGSPARLIAAVRRANQCVCEAGWNNPAMYGMGTTFAGVLAQGAQICVAHVGDSRVYRLRDGTLDRLTEDHTFQSYCLNRGVPPWLASRLPERGALTRAIGLHDTVEVDTLADEARPGDLVLICTDGISGVLKSAEIAEILAAHRDLGAAADALIQGANERGGPDNATCVVVRWSE